jgi:hypothetical protein
MPAPTYRTTDDDRWGTGKGSNLTPVEVDENFWNMDQRVVALEETPPTAISIASIAVTGRQMTVTLTDSTELGPFTIPFTEFTWKGEWLADTNYDAFDVIYFDGTVYLVKQDHLSDSVFDPAREITGQPVYQVMFVIPTGGGGGTPLVDELSGTTHTLVLGDAGTYFHCSNAAGCDITIPSNDDVAFPIGTEISFRQFHDGQVSVAPDSGVTLDESLNSTGKTRYYGQVITIKKVDTDAWDLFGDDEDVNQVRLQNSTSSPNVTHAHNGAIERVSRSSLCTYAVPMDTGNTPSSLDKIPIGFKCQFIQEGSAQVAFSPGSGVTIHCRAALQAKTRDQYSVVHLEKLTATLWHIYGDLADA